MIDRIDLLEKKRNNKNNQEGILEEIQEKTPLLKKITCEETKILVFKSMINKVIKNINKEQKKYRKNNQWYSQN
jgi:hypothetical protein